MHSYWREKLRHYLACFVGTAAILVLVLYLFISPIYGLYRWQIGFVAAATIAVLGGVVYHHYRLYCYYVQGYKCPACGGLVEMDEISLLGAVKTDDGAVPQVIDRISTCTLCGKENHLVYVHSVFANLDTSSDRLTQSSVQRLQRRPESRVAKVLGITRGQAKLPVKQYRYRGPFVPFYPHALEMKAALRQIGLDEQQMQQVIDSERTLSDLIGEYLPNYDDWYRLVRELQQSADRYNQQAGIRLPWPEWMYYVPEGFDVSWLLYGKYEWKDGEYRKVEYARRPDRRKTLNR